MWQFSKIAQSSTKPHQGTSKWEGGKGMVTFPQKQILGCSNQPQNFEIPYQIEIKPIISAKFIFYSCIFFIVANNNLRLFVFELLSRTRQPRVNLNKIVKL